MHGLDSGVYSREPAGWARPVWGKAVGRQHAGGLARSAQSRSTKVMAVSQEGGIEITLGQGERKMGVGLDSRHLTTPPPPEPQEDGIEVRTADIWTCCCFGTWCV